MWTQREVITDVNAMYPLNRLSISSLILNGASAWKSILMMIMGMNRIGLFLLWVYYWFLIIMDLHSDQNPNHYQFTICSILDYHTNPDSIQNVVEQRITIAPEAPRTHFRRILRESIPWKLSVQIRRISEVGKDTGVNCSCQADIQWGVGADCLCKQSEWLCRR